MTVINSVNWPLSTRLICMALHAPAVDVSQTYHPKNHDVVSVQCPDCERIYWRYSTAVEKVRARKAREAEIAAREAQGPKAPAERAPPTSKPIWMGLPCA